MKSSKKDNDFWRERISKLARVRIIVPANDSSSKADIDGSAYSFYLLKDSSLMDNLDLYFSVNSFHLFI